MDDANGIKEYVYQMLLRVGTRQYSVLQIGSHEDGDVVLQIIRLAKEAVFYPLQPRIGDAQPRLFKRLPDGTCLQLLQVLQVATWQSVCA